MNAVVACEEHFLRTPDGQVWTTGQFPFQFWSRYLSAFDSVRVVARVRDVNAVPGNLRRASGTAVDFAAVPDYRGPEQFLLEFPRIRSAVANAVCKGDAVILRVPGQVSSCVEAHLRESRKPYGVEVVADPYDAFSPGAVRHTLRGLFRWWFPRKLRQLCKRACAATYVTEAALQRRYPPAADAFSTSFSDVELSKDSFVAAPRVFAQKPLYRLIFVGGLSQLYKAPDVLLDAVAECLGNRCRLDLAIAGSGQYQHSLALRAESLGISNRVKFLGQLTTPEAVRQALDEADLFVLPSRQEGLPRAMIEAMARALPCIGSTVGGIPELLPASDLVPPNDPQALSKRIGEVLADPTRMNFMSARNLRKAREFLHTPEQRRQAFYRHVRTETEQWLARKSTS